MFLGNDREDKLRNRAAVTIQCAYRCHLARIITQDRYRSQFRKIYDADAEKYIYQNKKNLEIDIKLPTYFKKSSLPSPRDLEAPIEYNPGNELNADGCALIITNTVFPLGKWLAQAPIELENDHDQIIDLLTHEFIGRMRPENVLSYKNPNSEDIRVAFKKLRSISRSYGFAFIYIATHVITMSQAEKGQKKNETSYFAFKNSIWSNNNLELVETTISLSEMSKLINKIPCKEKSIFINYAHNAPPRKVLFPSSKLLYPPPDCLQRLADLCHSPVVGSCSIGSNVREYMKYHPGIEFQKNSLPSTPSNNDGGSSHQKSTNDDGTIKEKEDEEKMKSKSGYDSDLWHNLLKDFEIPPIQEVTKTPKPEKPLPTWKQDASTDYVITVQMPSQAERSSYARRVLLWSMTRGAAKPVNLLKRLNIMYKKYSLALPEQTSLVHKGNSLFGKAVIRALNGGASKPGSNYINLSAVYLTIYNGMKKAVAKMNERAMQAKKISDEENQNDNGSGTNITSITNETKIHYNQIPVLFIPKTSPNTLSIPRLTITSVNTGSSTIANTVDERFNYYLQYRIFFRCSPPPAPEKPFINEVQDDSVTLEWFNPAFQGIPPTKYKIYTRNNTRNYRKWTEIPYPGDINRTVFTVRNLPMGVSCEFKVAAFNAGGWGEPSEETDGVVPGEDKTSVIPKRIKWKRLQQSGILGILDYLTINSFSYEEQEHGLQIILGMIQTNENGHGLKSYKLIIKLLERIFQLLQDYSNHPMILSRCFTILGCCFTFATKYERKLRHYCISQNLISWIEKYDEIFFYHSHLQNSLQYLKQGEFYKYFQLQQKEKGLLTMKEKGKTAMIAPAIIGRVTFTATNQDSEEIKSKERKYLLNYSIPGRHKVLFPADDSDDDIVGDSDEDDEGDNPEEDAQIEAELKLEEEMKQKEEDNARRKKKLESEQKKAVSVPVAPLGVMGKLAVKKVLPVTTAETSRPNTRETVKPSLKDTTKEKEGNRKVSFAPDNPPRKSELEQKK